MRLFNRVPTSSGPGTVKLLSESYLDLCVQHARTILNKFSGRKLDLFMDCPEPHRLHVHNAYTAYTMIWYRTLRVGSWLQGFR